MVAVTRRRLLIAAGVLAATAVGCGREEAARIADSDAKLLGKLAAAHHRASAEVIGSSLAERIAAEDARWACRLARIAGLAAAAVNPATQSLDAALDAKQKMVFAAVGVLPELDAVEHRRAVMELIVGQAEQLAELRAAADRPAVQDAFAGYTKL